MSTPTEIAKAPKKSELTIRLENRGIDPMLWNAIGSSIFPGAADESKLMAIDYCKSRGLDIMKKPCHIVPMNVKDAKTGQYSWRDIIMPGIAEIRITADRTGKYAGQDAPIFGPMVEMEFGKTSHTVPEFCTITVYKITSGQRVAFTHTEFFEEACNTTKDGSLNSMWTKRKRGQLVKCAEAGALRKAFPEESGGMITADEATDDHIKVTTGRVVTPAVNPYLSAPDPVADLPETKFTDSAQPNTYTELKGSIPDMENPESETKLEASPANQETVKVSAEMKQETESTDRANLVAEIKATLKATDHTFATFAPKCRDAGLLAVGVQLAAAELESLREIAANIPDILAGNYLPLQ